MAAVDAAESARMQAARQRSFHQGYRYVVTIAGGCAGWTNGSQDRGYAMSKPRLRAVRLALLGALVLWYLFALANPDGATSLLERTISPDGHIQNRNYAVHMIGAVLLALAFIGPAVLERWRSALADLAQGRWWTEGSEVMLVLALVLIHAIGIGQDEHDRHLGADAKRENQSRPSCISWQHGIAGEEIVTTRTARSLRESRRGASSSRRRSG